MIKRLGIVAVLLMTVLIASSVSAFNPDQKPQPWSYDKGQIDQGYAYLRDGLVGHWPMWEGAGALRDISGKNNHGTAIGGGRDPSWQMSVMGLSLSYDGSNDYTSVGDTGDHDFGSNETFSVSFWFNTADDATGQLWQGFVSKEDFNNTPRQGWTFMLSNTNLNKLEFGTFVNGSGDSAFSAGTVNDGLWHHAVGVRNIADGQLELWLDGVLEGTDTTISTGDTSTVAPLVFGRRDGEDLATYHLNVELADVRIYDRALSAQEIRTLYEKPFIDLWPEWMGKFEGGPEAAAAATPQVIIIGWRAPEWLSKVILWVM